MEVKYIAIEREYGSGGTRIAQEAAARCGVACYGPEILKTVAQRQNVSISQLQEYEETVSNSFLYSLFVMTQSQTGNPDLLSDEAKLFVAEARVIQELAGNGPAIFVGHSASQALKHQEGVLRVFIHADQEFKYRRITEDYGIPAEQVESVCRRFQKRRANYYNFCTHQKWDDYGNYDMVLDSSRLGISGCAKVLSALFSQ